MALQEEGCAGGAVAEGGVRGGLCLFMEGDLVGVWL